jgi:hypothetical protein
MKYVIGVNSGLYEGGKVFNGKEKVEKKLMEWSGGKDIVNEDGEVVSVDMLIDSGGCGYKEKIMNECMCEMGDDYMELSVYELKEEGDD